MTINEAVRELRKSLGWSQQRFATELGLAIRTVVNYEQERMPNLKTLARLETLATGFDYSELAYVFTRAIGDQLGTGRVNRGPLNSREQLLRYAFDRCVIEHGESKDAKRIVGILEPYLKQIQKEDRLGLEAVRKLQKPHS